MPAFQVSTASNLQKMEIPVDERAAAIRRLDEIEFALFKLNRQAGNSEVESDVRAKLHQEWRFLVARLGLTKE